MKQNEPFRIVVETVPHDVVQRLDQTDQQLRREVDAMRRMFSQTMEVVGELRREVMNLKRQL